MPALQPVFFWWRTACSSTDRKFAAFRLQTGRYQSSPCSSRAHGAHSIWWMLASGLHSFVTADRCALISCRVFFSMHTVKDDPQSDVQFQLHYERNGAPVHSVVHFINRHSARIGVQPILSGWSGPIRAFTGWKRVVQCVLPKISETEVHGGTKHG